MKHIILGFFLSLAACAKNDGCQDLVSGAGPVRLVVIGDSQAAGHATESSKDCGFSFANILARRKDMALWNYAVAGSEFTSDDQYGVLMTAPLRPTDRVVMLIGFNDMRNNNLDAAHLDDFEVKLRQALERVSPLVHRVVIGTCLTPLSYDLGSQAARDAYRARTRSVATALGALNVIVLDVGDSINHDASYFVDDALHLNLRGQEVLAADFEGSF